LNIFEEEFKMALASETYRKRNGYCLMKMLVTLSLYKQLFFFALQIVVNKN
jgi:hypothetical protein